MLLCAEEVDRIPDEIPGVYILHSFDPGSGFYPPVYVGKTRDLRVRLVQHLDSTSSTSPDVIVARSRFRIYLSAAPVLDTSERDGVEGALIQVLRPRCNRQVPRMVSVYPNLPPLTVGF